MLVKKEMWRVYTKRLTENPKPVVVIWDTDNDEPVNYKYNEGDGDDDWYMPDDGMFFFENEKLALAGRKHIVDDFLSHVDDVRMYSEMYYGCHLHDQVSCEELFDGLALTDVFGLYMGESLELFEDDRKKSKSDDELSGKLIEYMHTGYLCFNGTTFKPEDVKRVEWVFCSARIIMNDGSEIYTANVHEYALTRAVFGVNTSNVTKED